ncbi:MAG TPA: DUF4236 domain-containing protein [Thermoanaerobaculia bacterium]|nr:DUF4236 domain-containing protein [Thermoanaerobaculia bacterium]
MGFYLRQSLSLGPFRFNLSGSGVGVSVGVPGFRVGTGPRGNYVRLGRGGVYYQHTIPAPAAPRLTPRYEQGSEVALQEIESASALQIVDSSSEELLNEIRAKRRKVPLTPFAIVAAVVLLSMAFGWPALVFGLVAIIVARYRDKVAKTVVILYELDPAAEEAFRRFHEWGAAAATSRRAWHIAASGRVHDRKYHAGASSLVQRNPTTIRTVEPPGIRTNVPVLSIGVGRQTLYFLPDRLLVYDGRGIGAISYSTLEISAEQQRFIEESGVPADATVVGHTWRYVNKSGGPDRRFNNNPQLPICLYDELWLRTASGLNEIVQLSRSGIGEGFAAAVRQLGRCT